MTGKNLKQFLLVITHTKYNLKQKDTFQKYIDIVMTNMKIEYINFLKYSGKLTVNINLYVEFYKVKSPTKY